MLNVDYLIVGAGFYGSILAYHINKAGLKCLVIDKRNHIGGNCYTENIEGIDVHKYGAHIFHTDNEDVWKFINQFTDFNNFVNSPMAVYKNEIYNLPFNMNTFSKLFNAYNVNDVKKILNKEKGIYKNIKPKNLEEQALKLVGDKVYKTLIKGYTEKQWGKKCIDLPSFIINRLPVRFKYDNNYFNDKHQGIPKNGYSHIINKLLKGVELKLNTSYNDIKNNISYNKMIYTGMIDEFYNYIFGKLEYRSLRFENKLLNQENYQGNAVINYTDYNIPYTRIIEHKHFNPNKKSKKTYISKEFSQDFKIGINEPYYPIGMKKNKDIYNKYYEYSKKI